MIFWIQKNSLELNRLENKSRGKYRFWIEVTVANLVVFCGGVKQHHWMLFSLFCPHNREQCFPSSLLLQCKLNSHIRILVPFFSPKLLLMYWDKYVSREQFCIASSLASSSSKIANLVVKRYSPFSAWQRPVVAHGGFYIVLMPDTVHIMATFVWYQLNVFQSMYFMQANASDLVQGSCAALLFSLAVHVLVGYTFLFTNFHKWYFHLLCKDTLG